MGLKKITSDDLENTILNPLENYLSSFKSEYTKERYTKFSKKIHDDASRSNIKIVRTDWDVSKYYSS